LAQIPEHAAAADFNGDGTTDLAICNFGDPTAGDDGSVSLLLGKGAGAFQPATNFTAVKNCTDLVTGDFDSDGRADLLVVREGDPNLADNGDPGPPSAAFLVRLLAILRNHCL
jgi:hypothetical protein